MTTSFLRRAVLAVALLALVQPLSSARAQSAGAKSPAMSAEQLYTVLIYERPAALAKRTDPSGSDAYWTSYDTFAAALMKAGALRGGSALDETVAITVRGTGSADRGVVGARLGGYFIIAAPSRAAAESLARLAPAAAVMVEVRPHRDNPHASAMRPR